LEEALERTPDVPRKVIQIAEDLQVWAEEKRESWRLEHGVNVADERDEGYKAGRGAPDKAPMPIGRMVGTGNKRHFDRMSLGPCGFCKRKGHNKETCMVMPVFQADGGQQTELQKKKVAFVQGLLEKKPRTAEERMMRPGESRLDAAKRAIAVGEEANRGNPWMTSEKRRDKLRRRLGYWWAIGADRVVLSWIGYGVELKFERPPPRLYFANHRSYSEHEEHVEKEHVQHLADGSFEEVDGSEVQIGNPLQVEVNEKGKARTCQDSRFANAYIADYAFTQETLSKHVAMILERDMQMITTDVEKAYYQVPLHKRSQPYLAWRHRGRWIKPTIIVFGIKPAPFVFTKMMRVLLLFIRLLGVRGSNCIDDNLWADMGMDEVVTMVKLVFGETGWTFNSKCVFKPSTLALYNGMWLDTKRFEVRAVDEKIDAARRLAWTIWYAARDGKQVNVRDLQKLTGRLQSMKLAIEGVAVWTRGIYADIAKAQEEGGGGFLPSWAVTHLREAAMRDVWFWAMRLGRSQFNGLPIHEFGEAVHMTMNTDASDVGWGAYSGDDGGWKIGGELPQEVLTHSSTAREIKGLQLAAAQRVDSMRGRNVRICMDSYPAIRNLINGGGPVEFLNEMVREWWEWTRGHKIRPTYQWIPREENTEADKLSKIAAETLTVKEDAMERVRDWLEREGHPSWHCVEWLRTRVQAPVFHHVAVRVGEMLGARRPVCIIVPTFYGQTWWARLKKASAACLPLGRVEDVIQGRPEYTRHNWTMEAHVFIPELKKEPQQGGRGRKKA
jgi:hypothetical protein